MFFYSYLLFTEFLDKNTFPIYFRNLKFEISLFSTKILQVFHDC